MVKGRIVTEAQDCVLKFLSNDSCGLCQQVLFGCREERGGKDETFERSETNTINESLEIKITKNVALALVYAVAKTLCKKWIPCKTLCFLNEKTKGECCGSVEGGRLRAGGEAGLRMDYQTTNEMEICVYSMLLGQLKRLVRALSCKGKQGLADRISI